MAFRYRLEAVLRLQRSLEKQEENRLVACAARVAGIKNQIKQWETSRMERRCCVIEDLCDGVPAGVLMLAEVWDRAVERKISNLTAELERAEKARREQWDKLRRERQKREVLESLRRQQLEGFETGEKRKAQQRVDELHLLRMSYDTERE